MHTPKKERDAKKPRPGLSDIHRHLVDVYFKPKSQGGAGLNKTLALEIAGYASPRGYLRVFDRPDVAAEIERRFKEARDRSEITFERVTEEIKKIAFANIDDYVSITEDGHMILDFRDADMVTLAAIGEVTVETYTEGRGEDAQEVKRVRVKPHNKLAALEMLMKHAGLSKDKVSLELSGDLARRLVQGRQRLGRGGDDET